MTNQIAENETIDREYKQLFLENYFGHGITETGELKTLHRNGDYHWTSEFDMDQDSVPILAVLYMMKTLKAAIGWMQNNR